MTAFNGASRRPSSLVSHMQGPTVGGMRCAAGWLCLPLQRSMCCSRLWCAWPVLAELNASCKAVLSLLSCLAHAATGNSVYCRCVNL